MRWPLSVVQKYGFLFAQQWPHVFVTNESVHVHFVISAPCVGGLA
jgi:hypothetical protein